MRRFPIKSLLLMPTQDRAKHLYTNDDHLYIWSCQSVNYELHNTLKSIGPVHLCTKQTAFIVQCFGALYCIYNKANLCIIFSQYIKVSQSSCDYIYLKLMSIIISVHRKQTHFQCFSTFIFGDHGPTHSLSCGFIVWCPFSAMTWKSWEWAQTLSNLM